MKGRPQAKNSTCVAFSIFWDLYVLKYMELLQKNKKEKKGGFAMLANKLDIVKS